MKISEPDGPDRFLSTVAPGFRACRARPSQHPLWSPQTISNEKKEGEVPNRIRWESEDDKPDDKPEEGIDNAKGGRLVVVLVDHNIAMVWRPYWLKRNGRVTHVGTYCFTLAKHPTDTSGNNMEWKVVGLTDTRRPPSEEDRKRLE